MHPAMIEHIDLQGYLGVDERLFAPVLDVNLKRDLHSRLQFGSGFKSDVEVTVPLWPFLRQQQAETTEQEDDEFHALIVATYLISVLNRQS